MIRLRTRFHMLTIVAAVVTLGAFVRPNVQAGQASAPQKSVTIEIDNFKFGVVNLEIAAGTTVTWTNRDDVPHTVVSTTKVFRSAPLDTNDSFSYTFKTAGTFEYFCSIHPHMTGKVVVK